MPTSVWNLEILSTIIDATDVSTVIKALYESCLKIGGDKLSYHPEVMFEGVASAKSEVVSIGFPEAWMKIYTTGGGQVVDPVPDIVMQHDRVMTWREASSKLKLTNEGRALLKEARNHGVETGLGFPLWGPKGQNAFAAIGFPGDKVELSNDVIQAEHLVLQAGHMKIVQLSSSPLVDLILSEREREVLVWMAKGKSNTDIATILSISPETIATYKRRIYRKLDCHDRIGAVMKALRLGLIHV